MLTGFPTGEYTGVFEVYADRPVTCYLRIGDRQERKTLEPGWQVFSLPCYVVSGTTTNLMSVQFSGLPNGAVVRMGRFRLFAGRKKIETSNTVVVGTGTPGSGDWFNGDIQYDEDPAAGGYVGIVATATNTWKSFGAIAA
jgi:hypothetical protein